METNEKTKKNGVLKIIIIIISTVSIIALAGFAFARYITKINGTATADIAKWSIKVNGSTNQNFVIDLATTRTGVTQEAEVQQGYIGPGTAGAFQIELDATGSEASLEYDINLNANYSNNTAFPKNLIFYSDSTMLNAIYHDNSGINLNGFIGWNDNSQVHTKTIYWKWDFETGSTQNEINTNDQLDSYWIGRPISLSMNVTAKQVNENPTTGQYAVTFDANGGTIQGYGNSSQATKTVTYGDIYGDLPTPTRNGYTFMGWNGKNLSTNQWRQGDWNNTTQLRRVSTNDEIFIPAGQSVTFSHASSNTYIWSAALLDNEKLFYSTISWNDYSNPYTFIPTIDTYAVVVWGNVTDVNGIRQTDISPNELDTINFMVEYGSVANQYEPFYITASTEVVQNQNHTLTAIWEPIE